MASVFYVYNVPPLAMHPGTQQCLSDDMMRMIRLSDHHTSGRVENTRNKHFTRVLSQFLVFANTGENIFLVTGVYYSEEPKLNSTKNNSGIQK